MATKTCVFRPPGMEHPVVRYDASSDDSETSEAARAGKDLKMAASEVSETSNAVSRHGTEADRLVAGGAVLFDDFEAQ